MTESVALLRKDFELVREQCLRQLAVLNNEVQRFKQQTSDKVVWLQQQARLVETRHSQAKAQTAQDEQQQQQQQQIEALKESYDEQLTQASEVRHFAIVFDNNQQG